MPLFKTKTIPVKAARSVMLRGRPPLGLGGSGGKSGAMIAQSASLTNGVLMPQIYHMAEVLLGALSLSFNSLKGDSGWKRPSDGE
jgi:hypothetical protein